MHEISTYSSTIAVDMSSLENLKFIFLSYAIPRIENNRHCMGQQQAVALFSYQI